MLSQPIGTCFWVSMAKIKQNHHTSKYFHNFFWKGWKGWAVRGKQGKSFITYEYLFISYEHLFISYEYLFISYERLLVWKKGESGGGGEEKVEVEMEGHGARSKGARGWSASPYVCKVRRLVWPRGVTIVASDEQYNEGNIIGTNYR